MSKSHGIDQPIYKHRRREKPRLPAIVRPRREGQSVEGGAALLEPQYLLPYSLAEIRRQGYALAAVSHAIVQALVPAQMRQGVEGVRHPPHPRVTQRHGMQLRQYALHHAPQTRHAGERVLLGQRRAAAAYDALAVRRSPEIHDDSPRIDDVSPARNQRTNAIRAQGFGGDLIAADGDDSAPMPGRQRTGVSIGRKQYLARMNDSARRQCFETVAGRPQSADRAALHHRRASLQRAAQQAEQQPRGIEGSGVRVDTAAVIEVAGDLAVLLRPGYDADPLLEPARLILRIPRHSLEMP